MTRKLSAAAALLAACLVPLAGLRRAAGRRLGARGAERAHQLGHVPRVRLELGVRRADAGLETAHQKSDRRLARPCVSMVAICSFTCSTFSAMTSSSSLGLPSKNIGSPK